jgi:hypothetical protein
MQSPDYNHEALRQDWLLLKELSRDMSLPTKARKWAADWAVRVRRALEQ